MRTDAHLPDYDAVSRRHAVVDAPPETVYETMLSTDFTRLGPVVETLGQARALPNRVNAWLRGGSTSDPESLTLGELHTHGTWVRLDAVADEEFVFGAVGTVWRPDVEWVELDVDAFATFDRPGYAKIAASLSLRLYGTERTLLTYEARTLSTDPTARRGFRRYWLMVGPFVSYILGRVVVRIGRDAERAHCADA